MPTHTPGYKPPKSYYQLGPRPALVGKAWNDNYGFKTKPGQKKFRCTGCQKLKPLDELHLDLEYAEVDPPRLCDPCWDGA